MNKRQRIKLAINASLENLQTQFNVIDRFNKIDSKMIYLTTQNNQKILDILAQVKNSDTVKRDALRRELYNLLENKYEFVKLKGVLQFHFVMPDNTTFLRMHKPTKYDDDLGKIRYSFVKTNRNYEPTRGFEQGKTAHSFRNTYPVFDKDGNYLCALDISYGSEVIQNHLTEVNQLHTHFLVHKNIFDIKIWERKDLQLKYFPSVENEDYMFAITKNHTIEQLNKTKHLLTKSNKQIIKKNMGLGKAFGIYMFQDKKVEIKAFLPIRNIRDKKVVAYLVSQEPDGFIRVTILMSKIVRSIMFLIFAVLAYVIYKNILVSRTVKKLNFELEEKVKKRTQELEFQKDRAEAGVEKLKLMASKDFLTNLYNRRFFAYIANNAINLAKRQTTDFSSLMIDVDKFKNINDTYGHRTGDEVLKILAGVLTQYTRESDIVARFGGEEFVILLPGTNVDGAKIIAEKIRHRVESKTLQIDGESINYTISIGVSQFNKKMDSVIDTVLDRADKALYEAKNSGRNRVIINNDQKIF
ncbi:diguanylate cyclase [bacterium]|nr:diguanylate cyclase [bacterium]